MNPDKVLIHEKYIKNLESFKDYFYDNVEITEKGPFNDIALLRFTINKKLLTICLPLPLVQKDHALFYEKRFINCKILGQGFKNEYDEETFTMSKDLQLANVYISSNDICKSKFESNSIREKINTNTICIVGPVHPCLGDSGGPLICLNKYTNLWNLVGITSFAVSSNKNDRCGQFKSAVFVKVSNYLDWIYKNIR